MDILMILKVSGAVLTIATGLISLIAPRRVQGFIGLDAPGGRGITEIRAVLGGFFIALGAAPLISGEQTAYWMLGVAYLTVGVVRAVSMVIDKSIVQSNIISVIFEFVFGVILVL